MIYLLSIVLLFVVGCTEQVTVVAIEEDKLCREGKLTVMDGIYGRFKRCGVWGKVGERFMFSRM